MEDETWDVIDEYIDTYNNKTVQLTRVYSTKRNSSGGQGLKEGERTLEQHSKDPQLDLPFSKPTVQRPQRFVLLMSLL